MTGHYHAYRSIYQVPVALDHTSNKRPRTNLVNVENPDLLVRHDADELADGETVVLTLKDRQIGGCARVICSARMIRLSKSVFFCNAAES
jgi:hypothetical protein